MTKNVAIERRFFMNAADAIEQLEAMGFDFRLSHGFSTEIVLYRYKEDVWPDPEITVPLFLAWVNNWGEAVEFLRGDERLGTHDRLEDFQGISCVMSINNSLEF